MVYFKRTQRRIKLVLGKTLKMDNHITVIYYTANMLKEDFAQKVRNELLKSIGDLPLISISKKPLKFGENILDLEPDRSVINVYKAVLTASKLAKTKYVALCEDDSLYSPSHFHSFRPELDTFAYNLTRWNLFTWSKPPFYSIKFRRILASLIAPRELLINALEERFNKYPDLSKLPEKWMGEPGRNDYEAMLGVKQQKVVDFYTYDPLVVFSHPDSLGFIVQGSKKRANPVRALEIPYWGRAEDVLNKYYL